MACEILMSIKPRYAGRILEGTKRFEFRKRLPAGWWPDRSEQTQRVVIYESSPSCSIVGEFVVSQVLRGTPASLWEKTLGAGGIDRARYDEYFKGCAVAFALEVRDVQRYAAPIGPREVDPQFRAPQSWCYAYQLHIKLKTAIDEAAAPRAA